MEIVEGSEMKLSQSTSIAPIFDVAARLHQGDVNALDWLVREFSPLVKGIVLAKFRWLRDEWEDIAHDVFLRLFKSRPLFEAVCDSELKGKMKKYVKRTLRSVLATRLKKTPLKLIPNAKELADLVGIDCFKNLDDDCPNKVEMAFQRLISNLTEVQRHVCLAKAMSDSEHDWTRLVESSIVKDKKTARSILAKVRRKFANFLDEFFPPKGKPNGKE